ncbi:MAG: endonuclease [Bacilli bacterium]|nr:endonuclease [Bacilli bacterium]
MKSLVAIILLSLVTSGGTAISTISNAINKSAATPPTTIDLNDVKEEKIRDYYSGLNSLSEEERSGTNLLKNLKPILKNNQVCYSYGDSATTAVWQAYEILDRDWKLSPASEIKGYDSSTNKITGYKYGTSNSNVGSNPYLHALYVNRDAENQTKAWGDHSQTNYGINQEHVWPKSLGFEDGNYPEGVRGDLMHLWAGNGFVNGKIHSNWYYGYVDKTKSYTDAGSSYSYLAGNLLGTSKTFGGTTNVFEPQNSDKGDIARIIFYMAARYNYYALDGDTIDSSNPNLEISNSLSSFSKSGYTSTQTTTGKIGLLQDLLEWNKLDPVDSFEIHRNNLMFNNFSFNRNPFIDFPEWADCIWGVSDSGTYNAAPTGSANPQSDKIAEGNDEPIYPKEDTPKAFDWKMIAIIAAAVVVVVVILIIIFATASKKNKKKMIKTAKKAVKKSSKKKK